MRTADRSHLFIVNGDSAAGSLRQGLGLDPASILVQHDVLSCGPLPPFESLAEWRQVRDEFWRQTCEGPPSSTLARNLLWNAHGLREAESVFLWMGSGLSDQLLLPSTVRLFELAGADVAKLATVQFAGALGKPLEIVGLGMLAPAELKNHPAPEPVSRAGIAELRRAWRVVTASKPHAFLALLREEAPVFPLLHRALRALLTRYPDVGTGLNAIDGELLKQSQAYGPKVAQVIAQVIRSNAESLDPVGDTYLLARLRRLADPHQPHPALEIAGDPFSIRGTQVKLTATGEEVLAGRRNYVELNGIDDWVGGVHLDSRAGVVWLRRGEKLVGSGIN